MDSKTSDMHPIIASPRARLVGWILSVAPSLLLLFSGFMKFTSGKEMVEGFEKIGWPTSAAVPLGVAEIVSTLLYLFPRTAAIGAILLTGYMGGAIATHARIHEPFVAQCLIGVVLWLGLFLREPRLRALIPLVRPARQPGQTSEPRP